MTATTPPPHHVPEKFALIARTSLLPLRLAACVVTIRCDRAKRYYSTKLFMETPAGAS